MYIFIDNHNDNKSIFFNSQFVGKIERLAQRKKQLAHHRLFKLHLLDSIHAMQL